MALRLPPGFGRIPGGQEAAASKEHYTISCKKRQGDLSRFHSKAGKKGTWQSQSKLDKAGKKCYNHPVRSSHGAG